MRQRSPNQKALEKLSTFLYEIKGRLTNNEKVNFSQLYIKYNISKSTLSVLRKLNYIIDGESSIEWNNPSAESDRVIGLKILEFLRQQSDKQSDKPINDLWVAEISHIKELLTQVRDNTKKQNNRSEGFKISERVYLAGQIASGCYVDIKDFADLNFNATNNFIIKATDDLLSKLNS